MKESFLSLLTALLGWTADRVSKNIMENRLAGGKTISLLGGRLILQRRTNTGFAMNRLEDRRDLVVRVSAVIFVIFTFFYALVLIKPAYRHLRLALGLLMGGAAGNIYDRLKKEYVLDFIKLKKPGRMVFNLADIFIVTGSLWTLLCELLAG